jgi:NADH-quinone oxidoreductase subunit J
MEIAFYITALLAVISTLLAISRVNAVHGLLYLIVSFLSIALIFFTGAIMVLFIFVVMLLNLGRAATEQEKQWLAPNVWWGPTLIGAALLFELITVLANSPSQTAGTEIRPLSARRRTGRHAAAGRNGGRLPSRTPRAARSR